MHPFLPLKGGYAILVTISYYLSFHEDLLGPVSHLKNIEIIYQLTNFKCGLDHRCTHVVPV